MIKGIYALFLVCFDFFNNLVGDSITTHILIYIALSSVAVHTIEPLSSRSVTMYSLFQSPLP